MFLFSSQRNPEFDQPCRTEAAESVARLFSPVEELVWICAGCSPSPCAGIQGDDDDDDTWTRFHLLLFGWPAYQGLDEFSPRSRERCQRIWSESSSTLSCSQGVLGTPISRTSREASVEPPNTRGLSLVSKQTEVSQRAALCCSLSFLTRVPKAHGFVLSVQLLPVLHAQQVFWEQFPARTLNFDAKMGEVLHKKPIMS